MTILLLSACNGMMNNENSSSEKAFVLPDNATRVIITGYLFIPGEADSMPGNFLIDLGADNLYLDSVYFHENNLTYENTFFANISGIGNTLKRIIVIRDSVNFTFKGYNFKTDIVPVLDLKPIGGDYVDGLLGVRYFMDKSLEINYEHQYIIIHSDINTVDLTNYQSIKLKRIDNYICAPITMKANGIEINGHFIIDTGYPVSSITSAASKVHNLETVISHKIEYYTDYGGIGGESASYDFIIDSVLISDFSLSNVNMSFSIDSAGIMAEGDYLGIIGNDILRRFDVIFDFANLNLYLKPNKIYTKPFVFDRLGFTYVDRFRTKGGWIVTGLTVNGFAEKQGLKIDDKIISVNNISVEDIEYTTQDSFFLNTNRISMVVEDSSGRKTLKFKLKPLL
ncbi:MAG: PDZ domain-containing protein [Salinivirgaceae bacterium]|nr:PDZ domain-containing protein [Salinivirgaceae bacterium]